MDTLRDPRAARASSRRASRSLPDARGIFGHSMGGHGALALALRNPGRYRSVSAFAPIVAPSRVPWGQQGVRRLSGRRRDGAGPRTTPARWCARGRSRSRCSSTRGPRTSSSTRSSSRSCSRRRAPRRARALRAAPPRRLRPQLLLHRHASSTSTSRTTRARSRPDGRAVRPRARPTPWPSRSRPRPSAAATGSRKARASAP